MSQPQHPVNVHLRYRDGTAVPMDCVFEGYDDDVAVWVAFGGPPDVLDLLAARQLTLHVDELPACTTIVFGGREDHVCEHGYWVPTCGECT